MKVLIVHGAGMETRGKVQIDVFGPMTLPEYDEHIRRYAAELAIEVEIFHSNVETEVIDKLRAAPEAGIEGIVINPAGYTTRHPGLAAALAELSVPAIELHVSNPARRGVVSEIARSTRGCIAGFGIRGYALALRGLKDLCANR